MRFRIFSADSAHAFQPLVNVLFIVQGEGRGHMTQALALAGILRSAGHVVSAMLVGRSGRRDLPTFFLENARAPVHSFDSPNFASDPHDRSVRVLPTLLHTLLKAPQYRDSLGVIGAHLRRYRPDLVVNFYEPLAGVYYRRFRPSVPMVCIGHQYLCQHPGFSFPEGRLIDRRSFQWFTELTASGAARRLALSFTPQPIQPATNLTVLPPLLRSTVFEQPRGITEPFFLIYLLNSGYAGPIRRWHEAHPEVELRVFWDNRAVPEVLTIDRTLSFHQLHGAKFLSMMARCSGVVCTAGFESVAEAMYLGKPVMMVPVEGHYEQHCNALDAAAAGAGIPATSFDIGRLLDFLPSYRPPTADFHCWVEDAPHLFAEALENAAARRPVAKYELETVKPGNETQAHARIPITPR